VAFHPPDELIMQGFERGGICKGKSEVNELMSE
jgi:hypothetical protein